MKPFDQLTNQGEVRRLRNLALNALDQYELEIANIRLVGIRLNTLFRVFTATGSSYLLRICGSSWRTTTDMLSEIIWLLALRSDPDIGAPLPQPARNGDFIVTARAEGVPEAYPCVLMSWIPGVLLGTRLTAVNLYKMGALFARLHEQALNFAPPKDFTQRKMDTIYACGEQDMLFDEAYDKVFTRQTREIFELTRDKINEAFKGLYANPAGLRITHNDLHHDNIKIYRGYLHPLDFEFMMWGYPVQDLAVALDGLMNTVEGDKYEPLYWALREGYESRLEWPEHYKGQIDAFQAARRLWVANYVAQFEPEQLKAWIDWLAPQFERFLETDLLRKS